MLNIQRGIHIDSGSQQFFNILIAPVMPHPRRVTMCQIINHSKLGLA